MQLSALVADRNNSTGNQVWYANNGANEHVTGSLENLSVHERFTGDDTIAVGDGQGLCIENTG